MNVVEMLGISKQFPGVLALNNVDLALEEGEIHGLVGENVNIDGYTHNGNLRPLHINGIAI